MRSMVIAGVILLAGCGAHNGSTAAPTPVAVVPCAVPVPSADSLEWKLVQASGFTFCVPPGWRPAGAQGWRGEGASIEWAAGRKPQPNEVVRRVPAGVGIGEPAPVPRHFVEIIGGESADLWDNHMSGTNYTSAEWGEKRVYFRGKSSGPRGADIELMIYRTVRFADSTLGT